MEHDTLSGCIEDAPAARVDDGTIGQDDAVRLIETYFRAKDGNRPHLMSRAFHDHAVVEMSVRTQAISFPPWLDGREAITDTLVRQFGQAYENVYSFCLQRPHAPLRGNAFHCDWMVAMTDKATRRVRVGAGRYAWHFRHEANAWWIDYLGIEIAAMEILPAADMPMIDTWLRSVGYPWACPEVALTCMPASATLDAVRDCLRHAIAPASQESRAQPRTWVARP